MNYLSSIENKNNIYSIQRTKYANQRTFLSYMRTGLAITSIAASMGKKWFIFLGILMIICSILQYLYVNQNLSIDRNPDNHFVDFIPIIYGIVTLLAIYIHFYN